MFFKNYKKFCLVCLIALIEVRNVADFFNCYCSLLLLIMLYIRGGSRKKFEGCSVLGGAGAMPKRFADATPFKILCRLEFLSDIQRARIVNSCFSNN